MKIEVLDHGYVELIEAWGVGRGPTAGRSEDLEAGIIEAARQSTQGAFRGWAQDGRLLRYLHEHRHGTPFEFAGMTVEVQAPIFVFREWHRHRTQSYNEASARYSPLPDLYYMPTLLNLYERGNLDTLNRQAASAVPKKAYGIGEADCKQWLAQLREAYDNLERIYKQALDRGVPKELARLTMPVGHYSRMRASANLRNWLAFITLRCDPAAQWEIRQFADAVQRIMAGAFPHTMALWVEGNR